MIMIVIVTLFVNILFSEIPNRRIVAEWEPALGTMIRWPLAIPSDLVISLAEDEIIYVLVETISQQEYAENTFNNWDIDSNNIVFIHTATYSQWTRDYGPQFLIGENHWEIINQQFNGYPEELGCVDECEDNMILYDCQGNQFCNDQTPYPEYGYDCYVNNEYCEDFNGDGIIIDWLGDGYCDNGDWGVDFLCDEYGWDCGDCGDDEIIDPNGYCDDDLYNVFRNDNRSRLVYNSRGWEEDDDTNIDFAEQIEWDIHNLPLYWTGGNFMTDGFGMGFSTRLMINENDINDNDFSNIMLEQLGLDIYHIFDNPNELSIQHIDCMAKLVNSETIIIKQVDVSSPEYECIESFTESFYSLNTFYNRPFRIHRIFCPTIEGGFWETNPVAAYTNSLILNDKVYVPQYNIPQDEQALETYRDAMPGYDVIGFIGSMDYPWYSEDALHCRTIGIFDPNMIHISHKSIRSEELINNNEIIIQAEAIDYGNINISIESMIVKWKYSLEDGPFNEFILDPLDNSFIGSFPLLNSQSLIDYFILATNNFGNNVSHPNSGWHQFITLESQLGDLNNDGIIDILDIINAVNIILNNEYYDIADMNSDGVIDILDVIQIINIVLNN